jgi:hypothetical protein
MITSSVLEQAPFVIVQRSVAEVPTTSPVTPETGSVSSVMVAVPEKTDHSPVPLVAVLPSRVAVVAQAARVWSVPAAAVVTRVTVAVTEVLDAVVQPPSVAST